MALTLCCAGKASDIAAQQASLDYCQKLKDGIVRYDELRRGGGRGSQMDAWKRSRRKLDKQFRESGCRYYRGRLK